MLAKTLRHLRSNAIAYAALFVALSGTAYAATQLPKNSVGAKQLKKQSVNAAKVKKNSLTGNQINEAKLGKVPNAAKLDGKSPGDFLAAGGTAVNADKLDGVDSAIFPPVTAPFLIFAWVTAFFFSFAVVTAFFFSCLAPTLFLPSCVAAKAVPPARSRNTNSVEATFA
ncbi:MAG TPA: hypothetical protein VFB52_00545 [Solirubrobacterales bacterium]|nr:hypothetical protein [Solirubrobacterales bacterium]